MHFINTIHSTGRFSTTLPKCIFCVYIQSLAHFLVSLIKPCWFWKWRPCPTEKLSSLLSIIWWIISGLKDKNRFLITTFEDLSIHLYVLFCTPAEPKIQKKESKCSHPAVNPNKAGNKLQQQQYQVTTNQSYCMF